MGVHDVLPSSMSMFMFFKLKISQDTVRIHHISSFHIIIGRTICTMGILDHPGLLKVGSFSIHIPMAMRMMVLHARTRWTVVTKILRVSMMYLYLKWTLGAPNVSEVCHGELDSL